MSDVIDSTAIQVPVEEKLKVFDTLGVTEQEEIKEQVANMQKVTAEAVLRSDQCYDILKQLYVDNGSLLLTTSPFVISVKQNLDAMCKHLSDPEGFKRSFGTLCADIANHQQKLQVLFSCHEGKSGAPGEEDIMDVLSLADGYNILINHFESGIHPLLQTLAGVVEKEYSSVLESELNATA